MQIIIGDPHGCLKELQALLRKVGFVQGRDDLVLLGDEIDRGPDPVGVVALGMKLGARRVLGNHEEIALRWLRHEKRERTEKGYKNPMVVDLAVEAEKVEASKVAAAKTVAQALAAGKPEPEVKLYQARKPRSEDRINEWRSLTEAQIEWLNNSPPWLDLGNNWMAVHAGFEPRPYSEQKNDRVMRVRYVDTNGDMKGFSEDSMDQPEGTVYWTEVWPGPHSVVYGHAVHSRRNPRIDARVLPDGSTIQCIGIDTGCCFGGRLTAMVFRTPVSEPEFVQVDAAKVYVEPPSPIPDEI